MWGGGRPPRGALTPLEFAGGRGSPRARAPPFAAEQVFHTLERAYGKPASMVFERFEAAAVASASVAQVHFAVLPGGREGAGENLQAGGAPAPVDDNSFLHFGARVMEAPRKDGRRLQPRGGG